MLEQYINQLMRWRLLIVPTTIILILALAWGMRSLEFDNDYRAFFDGTNPHLLAFEKLQRVYSKNDNVLIVLAPKDGNVFTPDTLTAVVDITKRAWQTPYSLRVDSISNFQYTYSEADDLTVIDLIESPQSLSEKQRQSIRDIALKEPLLVRRLISPEGHVTAVNVTVELPGKAMNEVPTVVASIRDLKQYINKTYPDLDVYLSGIVMMNNAFPEASQYDLKHLTPLMYLLILVVLFFLLHSFSGILTTLLVITFSTLGAMGTAGWLGIDLTSPLFSAPTIIMTMAIADCVHILSNWKQGLLKGLDKTEAMRESLRINFAPVFLTSITTAIGFLSLNFSDAPPFRDLGNTSSVGVMLAWLLSITFLPALVSLLPTRIKPHAQHKPASMLAIADFVIARQKQLLLFIGLLIIGLILFIPKNELNDVFVKYFDERVTFRTDSDFVVKNLTGLYFIDFSLNSGEKYGISKPEFLQQVEDFSNWLRTQPEVMHVNTITDIMKRLNKNMHADDPAWYKLPQNRELAAQYLLLYEMSLPYGLDLNNQIDINKQSTRISVTLRTLSTKQVLALEEHIRNWMTKNTPALMTYGSSPTVMFAHIGYQNIRSMLIGTILALILISLILIIALKSFRYGLLSLIPNLVPAGMAFGLWGMVNGNIGLSLSIVTAMTLGIVVDDTVHFMSKYLRSKREMGLNTEQAVRYAFSTVGVALWVTSFALVAGFLVLSTSAFELNSGMGLLVSIVISFALFIDFFFLPPLLLTLERWLHSNEKN